MIDYKRLLIILLMMMTISNGQTEIFDNGLLRFGTGAQPSINASGNLLQPFYYNSDVSNWRQLTYSSYPLDITLATGGDGTNEWNINGDKINNPEMTGQTFDASNFTKTSGETGYGTIVVKGNMTIGSATLEVEHKYITSSTKRFLKVITTVKNVGASAADNLRMWVGTQDDYIGDSDSNTKKKGNIVDYAFDPITNMATRAQIIQVSSGDEAILFYSASERCHTIIGDGFGWDNNLIPQDPLSTEYITTGDDSYAIFLRMNDLAVGESDNITWYYAAAKINDLADVIREVGLSAAATTDVTPNGATLNANSTVDGTGYWIAIARDATAPTDAQIKAGIDYGAVTVVSSGSGPVVANVTKEFPITGLTPGTAYDVYFVLEDATPEFSSITKAQLTTIGLSTVTTSTAVNNSTSLILGGDITSDGGGTISGRGVVYSTTDNTPEIGEDGVIDDANGTGNGIFSELVSGLSTNTEYHIRAYSINEAGTSYGDVISFTPVNTVPTAKDSTIVLDEDATFTFASDDFRFADPDDGAALVKIKITTLEDQGELKLNGSHVILDQEIAVADLSQLTFTPIANANGVDNDSLEFAVNDGIAYSSSSYKFSFNVTAVNDVPSFLKGADQTLSKNAGIKTVNGWATSLSAGPANESAQTLSFILSNDNNGLFSAGPSIDASGNLTYTPATNATGTAVVTVSIKDNGGTLNSGVDQSASQTFNITVTPSVYWIGVTSIDWHTNSNWAGGSVPSASDSVLIRPTDNSVVFNQPTISSNDATSEKLTLEDGAIITITTNRTLAITGNLIDKGGDFSVATGSKVTLPSSKSVKNASGESKMSISATGGLIINGDIDVEQ